MSSSWDAFLNESYIFENSTTEDTGWGYYLPRGRAGLHFSLDNQWAAAGQLDLKRFPSFAEATPAASLSKLVAAIKALGWAGIRRPAHSNRHPCSMLT